MNTNPYNIQQDPMFKHIFKTDRGMPATQTDPECSTAMYETRLTDTETWLRENPESLLEVDIDALMAIYKSHHTDLLDLGECISRYMEGLIKEQARETTDYELNI